MVSKVFRLDPSAALDLADMAYNALEAPAVAAAMSAGPSSEEAGNWEPRSSKIIRGSSGLSRDSGFALLLKGRSDKRTSGHRVVTIRGTQTGPDVLTDLSALPTAGPNGLSAHSGFVRTWQSMRQTVIEELGEPSEGPVHITGHSLGGALATLAAVDLSIAGYKAVSLYTYASPRVFVRQDAAAATSEIKADRIFRVYDWGDPVPFLPCWPYRHVPTGAPDYRVGGHAVFSASRHKTASYRRLVHERSWSDLGAASDSTVDLYRLRDVDYWLDLAKRGSNPFSSFGYWVVGRAMAAVLAAVDVGTSATVLGLTLLDLIELARDWLMRKALVVGDKLRQVIAEAMRWMGRAVPRGVDITAAFLAWVRDLMLAPFRAIMGNALNRPQS